MASTPWRSSLLASILLCALPAHSAVTPWMPQRRQGNGYDAEVVHIDVNAEDHDYKFQRFLTRPDISAPRWDFTVYDEDALSPGYWFAAPYTEVIQEQPGGDWVGPHIYDNDGELVWSGKPLLHGYGVFDFKVQDYEGQDMLTCIYRHENALVINNRYEIVKRMYTHEWGFEMNMHDFNIVDDGTRVLLLKTMSKDASREESREGGYDGICHVRYYGFEELVMDTMQPTFSWFAEGHVALSESKVDDIPMKYLCEDWDYIHINSVDKFPNGDYLLSGRHTDTLYRISGEDGSIVWRFGGRHSDFEWPGHFSGQHHARIRSANDTHVLVSFLDNANRPGSDAETSPWSRGLLIQLNTANWTAHTVERYDQPHGLMAPGRGSYQVLPEGNTLLGWTSRAAFTEYAPAAEGEKAGQIVLDATLRPELKSYRNYKFPWVGHPTDPPDTYALIFAAPDEDDTYHTNLYVSWNGATEVKRWNWYKVDDGERQLIASTPRRGFETAITYNGFAASVVAEALDADGNVLGASEARDSVAPPFLIEGLSPKKTAWIAKHLAVKPPRISSGLLHNPLFTFFGGVACALVAGLLGFAVWRCRSWRPTQAWWKERTPIYEVVKGRQLSDSNFALDDEEVDAFPLESEGDDDDGKESSGTMDGEK